MEAIDELEGECDDECECEEKLVGKWYEGKCFPE
jgi:hypothetical protein